MKTYVEKAPQYWWLLLLLRFLALSAILLFARMALADEEGRWAMLAVAIVLSLVSISFAEMHYELDEEGLKAWFWPFRAKAPYDAIAKVELGTVPWYAGMGAHRVFGTLYMNPVYGKAVVVHRTNGWSPRLVITPRDPRTFARLLEERVRRAKTAAANAKKRR